MPEKLPPLKPSIATAQLATTFATYLGFPVRVIDGSVYRCDCQPPIKLMHGEQAATWLMLNLKDRHKAYWLAAECVKWKERSEAVGYRHNEAIADAKARRKLRDVL